MVYTYTYYSGHGYDTIITAPGVDVGGPDETNAYLGLRALIAYFRFPR